MQTLCFYAVDLFIANGTNEFLIFMHARSAMLAERIFILEILCAIMTAVSRCQYFIFNFAFEALG